MPFSKEMQPALRMEGNHKKTAYTKLQNSLRSSERKRAETEKLKMAKHHCSGFSFGQNSPIFPWFPMVDHTTGLPSVITFPLNIIQF